jgi:addiction module HigA family antidote
MTTEERIWPDIAIPPGEALAETLDAMGLTRAELARRADRPVQAISEIILGKKEITPETALEFERVLGVPAHVWVRLEADYRTVKARLADRGHLKEKEAPLARMFPYGAMAKLGWVPATTDPIERVEVLLRFFGVVSLRRVVDQCPCAAWRRSQKTVASPGALAAWLRRGEIEVQHAKTAPFDAPGLMEMLPTLRSLTREKPEVFQPKLREILAQRGVALVLVPELPKTGAHGATRWLGTKAVLQLSLRYHWADIFWFTVFHELGHILRHGRREIFIEFDQDTETEQEREADAFATRYLIPEHAYKTFITGKTNFSAVMVKDFVTQVGVHPGIVVGRLQHEKRISHSYLNDLRVRYRWAEETAKD